MPATTEDPIPLASDGRTGYYIDLLRQFHRLTIHGTGVLYRVNVGTVNTQVPWMVWERFFMILPLSRCFSTTRPPATYSPVVGAASIGHFPIGPGQRVRYPWTADRVTRVTDEGRDSCRPWHWPEQEVCGSGGWS